MILNPTTNSSQAGEVSAAPRQWALWYLFCAVLLWLYAWPLLFHDPSLQFNTDEANYVWKAERISRDLGILADEQAWRRHPPLIPALVGLLAKFMSLQDAVLVTTKTFALIGIVMVYVLGVQLKGPIAGMIAGVFLAADPTYRALSNKFLLDIPLMILFVVCASFLVRGGRYRIGAVAAGIVALLVKDYGVLVLIFALACIGWDFLIGRGWRPSAVAGTVLGLSAVVLIPLGYLQKHIPPCCDAQRWSRWLTRHVEEAEFRIWHVLDNSVGWLAPGLQKRYLVLLLLLAVPFIARMLFFSTGRMNVILFAWLATVLGPYLGSYASEERVILLFAPALYLIVGVAVAQGLSLVKTPVLARSLVTMTLLGCVSVLLLAQRNPEVLYYIQCRFRAYNPTGEWIGRNVSRSAGVVFTRSSHQLRLYAKSDFVKDGGIFYGEDEWTGIPQTAAKFQQVLNRTNKSAYLIVDIEEKADPRWLYPPRQESAEAIHALGFGVVHVVWVPVGERCDIPDWPYYSQLPGFLKHLQLPLYRDNGGVRERIDAVVFQRNRTNPLTSATNGSLGG